MKYSGISEWNWQRGFVPMYVKCSGCDKSLNGDEKFCPECGRKLAPRPLKTTQSKIMSAINAKPGEFFQAMKELE